MPYSIQLPDGTIIEGIPDDLNPVDAKNRIVASMPDLFKAPPPPEPTKDTGFFDMMGRAVVRGGKQTGSLLADVLPAMAAKAVGADEYAAQQMAEAKQTQEEIAQNYAARYGQLSDVKGAGDILPFVAETIAEQIPNIATAIVPGAGGAVLGGRLAAQQAAKTAASRGAAEAAAARYGAQAATVGAGRGAMGGAFLGSYALNAPEIFQNIYETTEQETGTPQMEVGAALLAGSVSAALDSLLPAALVKQFTPGMKAGVVEKILERSGMAPGIARSATAGVVGGAATEAPTEAAQEAISIAAEKFVQENASAWGSPEFNRVVESFVRGGVGGGGISGVAGAIRGIGERRRAEPTLEETTGGRSTFDQMDAGETDELTRAAQTDDLLQETQRGDSGAVGRASERGVSVPSREKEVPDTTTGAEGPAPAGVAGVSEPTDRSGAGTEEQRASLEREINLTQQYIQDIRSKYSAKDRKEGIDREDPDLLGAMEYLQDLQAKERALRREAAPKAEVLGAGPGLGPRQLGERRTYELFPAEKAVTEEDLRFAGFLPNEIKRIMFNARPKTASVLAKDVLGRVAAGQIKINNELRAVTQEDIDNAQTPEERTRLETAFGKASQGTLLAPAQQMGLDLTPVTDETSRDFPSLIELGETPFELERPEGVAPKEVQIETPEEVPSVPLNLARTPERFFDFLKSLKPVADAEKGTKDFRGAIGNFIDEIKEFVGPYDLNRKEKQAKLDQINEFFDQYSLVSDPATAAAFPDSIKGKSSAQQAQIIQSRTKMPDLTKLVGINKLRADFKDFMGQKSIEKLGQRPESSALASLSRLKGVPTIAGAKLNELRLTPETSRTPEQKAAAAYFGRWNFGLAMRSAAYDIANDVPRNEMFSGQGGEYAQLFRKYLADNLPPEIVEYFDKSVDEYRYEFNRIVPQMKAVAEYRKNIKLMQEKAEQEDAELQKYLKGMTLDSGSPFVNFKPMHPAIVDKIRDNDLNGALDMIRRSTGNRYWLALANRLLEANLDVSVNFDRQADMVKRELSRIESTTYRLLGNIMDAYPDVYDKYLENTIQNPTKLLKSLQQIKADKLLPDNVLNSLPFKLVLDKYEETVPALTSGGTYFINDNIINLNSERGGTSYYTFFHEAIHAATAHAIRNPSNLNSAQKQALKELENLYRYTQESLPKIEQYGFTNLDEFIAEAFTNGEFQRLLRSVKYKNTESTLWTRFVRFVAQLLGGKDNALFATLANADILMSASRSKGPIAFTNASLNANAPPTPNKSVYGGTFTTLPADVKTARKWLDGVTQGRSTWQQAKGGVSKMLENVADQTRKYYLGAFTLRQLQDIIGGRLGDSAQNFINTTEAMLENRNAILQKVSKIKEKWEKFQSDHPELNRRMNRLMIEATLQGIDPAVQVGKNARMDAEWEALGKEAGGKGQEIYKEVRDFYKERVEDYKNTMIRNVELSMVARGQTAQEIAQRTSQLRAKFDEESIQPYFPLKRFGRFWLQVGKGKGKEFYMFDSAAARNAYRDELLAKGEKRPMRRGNDLAQASMENLRDIQALGEIEKIVDDAIQDDPVMKNKYASADQKVTSLRDSIKDSLEQLYYLTLPSKSVRKMFINRKQISGATEDMLRAFVDSSFHMAYQQSRFKFSRSMFEQLNAAEQLSRDQGEAIDTDYVAELRRRLEYIMNPTDTGTIPSLLSNVSFAWYLTAPASALVNMLGVPAIGFPVLSARFGSIKSAGTLLGYMKQFMSTGFKGPDGMAMPTLERSKMSETERRAYNMFVASGLIDITQSHDLAGFSEAPSNLYTGKMNTVMRGLSFAFHHAERFNREVMAMSSFKMAYEQALKSGDSQQIAFTKAVEQAKDLTYRSMFDYSTLNKPRYLQNAYAKVILQFKQFPQQMTYLLVRSGMEWFSNPTPELIGQVRDNIIRERARLGQPALNESQLNKAVTDELKRIKTEGRDRLLGTLGMTFLFAGATGMPLFSVMSSVIESVYDAFSDDDEPPLNFENWFKNWMAETFGDFWGDAVSRGIITQATGVNLADRMSLNDLWFRDTRNSQDEVTAFQNMLINLLGPTAGLGMSAAESLKLFREDQYWRAAERVSPAVLKQPLVAMRYLDEGVLTLKGDKLVDNITAKDALGQSMGFSPEKVAQKQKANIEKKTAEQDILNKRQSLLNAFFMGLDTNDEDFLRRVEKRIDKYNAMYPDHPITGKTLSRSVKARYRARALAEVTGGIPINKALIGTLEDMGYYGRTD